MMDTPYVYVKGEDNEESTENVAGSLVDSRGTWVARIWADFDGHDEVAAEIVLAVNSHEALVEALKDLLESIGALDECDCGGSDMCSVCNAHAALKLAGVKP